MSDRLDWERLLEQIGALTIMIKTTDTLYEREVMWVDREKLIERAVLLRQLGMAPVDLRVEREAA